jgi:peptidoglycan/LPS O-acetylase OafA/YrhL
MGRPTRTTGLKAVALLVALASLTINYGLIDLIDGYTGYIDQARNQVLDAGWGLVFGVILPLGVLAQLRRPERRIAGIQQTAVVGFVLSVAGAAGEEWRYLALAAGVIAACAVLLALHPARRTFLARGEHVDPVLLTLAAVAAGPSLVYAWRMASAQRRDLPPADAVSNGLHHWTVMTALGLLVLALVLLAALRPEGWRIPAMSASIAAAGWAISCVLAPELAAGSEGHAWAWAVIVWALATLAATIWPRTRDRRVSAALQRQLPDRDAGQDDLSMTRAGWRTTPRRLGVDSDKPEPPGPLCTRGYDDAEILTKSRLPAPRVLSCQICVRSD